MRKIGCGQCNTVGTVEFCNLSRQSLRKSKTSETTECSYNTNFGRLLLHTGFLIRENGVHGTAATSNIEPHGSGPLFETGAKF